MRTKPAGFIPFVVITLIVLIASACSPAPLPTPIPTATVAQTAPAPAPEWFSITMIDARTNQPFTIQDFQGKVVLVETMAVWCPNCRAQQEQVKKLHTLLPTPDLVSVSLDVDLNEDRALLAKYVNVGGYDWRFAVAPLAVDHALGNLYSAEYLNPPLTPMLFIDRKGHVFGLPNGIKSAEALKRTLEPHLAQ